MPDGLTKLPALPRGIEPRQFRTLSPQRDTIDVEARTVELAISSEAPVDRGPFVEILGHKAAEIDLEFIGGGRAPLLMDHNTRDQVGVVERVFLGADGKLRALVRFGKSARAEEVFRDVQDGIRTNISIGYELLELRLVKEEQGKPPVYRVVRWRPIEVSVVSIPADMTVGVGRAAGRASPPPSRKSTMDANTSESGGTRAAPLTNDQAEILALGDIAGDQDGARNAILRGATVAEYRQEALAKRGASRPLSNPPETGGTLSAPQIIRGFRVQFGRGEGARVPDNFRGQIVRTHDGHYVPILSREDRFADFLPNDDYTKACRELGLVGYLDAIVNGARSQVAQRALSAGITTAGGAMVPSPLAVMMIDRYRARSVLFDCGAQVVPMDTGTLRFARVTSDPAGNWRAENAAIADSDPAFDTVTLTKRSWGVMTRVSRELLQDAPNTEMQVMNLFARVAAVALDAAGLLGTGASNQPLGITGTSGIGVVSMGTNGAQLTNWSPILNAVQTLETANSPDITGMVMAPRTSRAINGFVDTTGQFLTPPSRVAGVPIRGTTSMPVNETQGSSSVASSIIMGDFRELMVGLGTEIELTIHPDRYADLGQVALIALMRGDVALQRPAAMCRIQGIIP
jgi:HK97 family phage major capsid protein